MDINQNNLSKLVSRSVYMHRVEMNFGKTSRVVGMQDSFEGAKKWIRELREKSSSNVVIVLCGNKVDLSEKRQVRHEVSRFPQLSKLSKRQTPSHGATCLNMQQAKTYAQSCGLLYTETSAKTGVNVHNMFQVIGR